MIVDVNRTTSLTIFTHLGQLLYDLSVSNDLARTLHREIELGNYLQTKRLDDVRALVTDLQNVQDYIFTEYDQWSYCSNSEFVKKDVIPMWNFDKSQPVMTKSNLYDAVDKFILNWENLISAVTKNETFIKYIKFIVMNSADFSYEYSNIAMSGLVDCEVERVNSFGTNIKILLVAGLVLLALFVSIIIGYIVMASKSYDNFWNFMFNNSQVSLIQLKREAIDRLFAFHGIDYHSENIENDQRAHKHSKIKTDINKKYIWRLMIFFVIAASYYLLTYFYLYVQCETSMMNRPKLLSNINLKRALLSRIGFFARDTYSPYLIRIFPKLYEFSSSRKIFERSVALYNEKDKEFRKKKYKKLMSKNLLRQIYETSDSSIPKLHYGARTGADFTIFEAYYISSQKSIESSYMPTFINLTREVQNEIGAQFLELDKNSKDVINSQLNDIILCTVSYSIALCILFFCYYLPYLNNESKQFTKLLILPTLLPMEEDKRMKPAG
ncbi:unnamed protein product [Blepharisma stoltei]|uniref:Uncharacterized protein n=1 Tax=Blepharisma stoltei TaxID=1481888 RepID=A0AAU9J3M5_9CILI|nr:unnamed protein product [Blepharisma stoltei]